MSSLLIYGAYGYTGRLIVEAVAKRGLRPIVAGRNPDQTARTGKQFGLESRGFALNDPPALVEALRGVEVVLHCAGPFSATSRPMLDACIKRGAHYLDITGEFTVMEAVAARDAELRSAGIMAMCGVGMDVVPTDCLAAHMKTLMPDAQRLDIYIRALEQLAPGTAITLVQSALMQRLLKAAVRRFIKGPSKAHRDANRCEMIAEVSETGNNRSCYLSTKEGYAFTAESASEIAKRVLDGGAQAGSRHPESCSVRISFWKSKGQNEGTSSKSHEQEGDVCVSPQHQPCC